MYKNDKIKNVQIDYARMSNSPEYVWEGYEAFFPLEKVVELLAMACEDIYPDEHYGDAECCLWGELRSVLRKENLKK